MLRLGQIDIEVFVTIERIAIILDFSRGKHVLPKEEILKCNPCKIWCLYHENA